jgi:phospholipid/cholesterol/gamma-HCH transport system substrate-binding protein/paraquat-inducible protein B
MRDKQKTLYVRVGFFVIAALVLILLVLIALGAGAFLRKSVLIETYLDESVQGLEIGSPVKHRGVQIGNVERIDFVNNVYGMDPNSKEYYQSGRYVYILMALDKGKLLDIDNSVTPERMDRIRKSGLRIRLAIQGLTGVAYLEADYFEPERYEELSIHWQPEHFYLPSIPSAITRVSNAIEQVISVVDKANLPRLGESLQRLSNSLSDAAEGAQVKEISDNLLTLLKGLQTTNEQVQTLVADPALRQIVKDAASGATHAKNTFATLDEELPPVIENADVTMQRVADATEELPQAIRSITRAVRKMERLLARNQQTLDQTFRSLNETSENVEETTEELKQHPSRAIFGAPPRPTSVYPPSSGKPAP